MEGPSRRRSASAGLVTGMPSAVEAAEEAAPLPEAAPVDTRPRMGDILDTDEIGVEIGPDLISGALDGARVEAVLEQVNIACNKNTTPGDKSALTPMGIRIGAPAMTSRGLGEEDFKKIAKYIDTCIKLCKKVQGDLPK